MYPSDALDGAIVSFLNYGTGTAIDLTEGKPQNGTPIIGYQFHGLENQQWKLERVDDNPVWPSWMIRNVKTGTYIDLYNGGSSNGTKITGWSGGNNGNQHQLWRLVSADPSGRVLMIQNIGTGTYIDLLNGNPANLAQISGWEGHIESRNPHQLWRILRIR
ncbi:hypothetical protein DL765_006499 [Monosporascus sp. GIB2]|nr:hypothetical protein DL765_006499 [Monosporascus sp. GIB2]